MFIGDEEYQPQSNEADNNHLWWPFPRLRGFWDKVGLFIPCMHFFLLLKVEISSCTLISFFRPGSVHSGLAS